MDMKMDAANEILNDILHMDIDQEKMGDLYQSWGYHGDIIDI